MTTAESPMGKTMSLLAHAIPALMVAAVAVRLPYYFGIKWWVTSTADVALSLMVMVGAFALVAHIWKGQLCLRCIQDSPDDPETEVQKKKWFLWFEHMSRRMWWSIWAGVLALILIAGAWTQDNGLIYRLSHLPQDVFFYSMFWAFYCHHRLHPWCPYCRGWDEGGEEELIPDPDPSERATR